MNGAVGVVAATLGGDSGADGYCAAVHLSCLGSTDNRSRHFQFVQQIIVRVTFSLFSLSVCSVAVFKGKGPLTL
jgi:hypothetical protein